MTANDTRRIANLVTILPLHLLSRLVAATFISRAVFEACVAVITVLSVGWPGGVAGSKYKKADFVKQRYKFDIKRMAADCEANYLRICRLLPAVVALADKARTAADTVTGRYVTQSLNRELLMALSGEEDASLTLGVQDHSRYTSTVKLELAYTNAEKLSRFFGGSTGGAGASLMVRMYHDMRLAEVVSVSGSRAGLARYEYPNDEMFQPDEKAQQNLFLAELLGLFVQQGRMASREQEFDLAKFFINTDSSVISRGAKRPIEVQLN